MFSLFVKHVKGRKQEMGFLLLVSTLISFIFSRLFVVWTNGLFYVSGNGWEVHHFLIGVALGFLGAIVSFFMENKYNKFGVLLFGLGAGVFLDELGFLVTMGNYWNWASYYGLGAFIIIAIILIYFRTLSDALRRGVEVIFDFWNSLWQRYLKGKKIIK